MLLVAALLLLLGGANRGRVPAGEREGSRTADEPAALSLRSFVAPASAPERDVPLAADDDAEVATLDVAPPPSSIATAAPHTEPLARAPLHRHLRSAAPRGPPTAA